MIGSPSLLLNPSIISSSPLEGASEICPVETIEPSLVQTCEGTAGPLTSVVSKGLLSFFGPTSPQRSYDLPPFDAELFLSDYEDRMPEEVAAYVAPLLQLEVEFEIPVSFRITEMRLSTGETVRQISFFRTSDALDPMPEEGSGKKGAPGGSEMPSPKTPSTMGLTFGLLGSSIGIVAFDQLLVKSLIDKGFMPKEAHVPVSFGGIMGAIWLFKSMGLTQAGPIESLSSFPILMGLQTLVNAVMFDGLKLTPNPVTQVASLSIASAPLFLAHQSPALAAALSGSGGPLSLRLGAGFAKILGWAAIIDMGAGAGVWALGRYEASGTGTSYDNNVRIWDLVRLSQFLFNQERYGSTVASTIGNLFTAMDTAHQLIGDNYGAYGQNRVMEIQNELVKGSDEFGFAMNEHLLSVVASHLTPSGEAIDWDAVQADVLTFYGNGDNSKNIKTGYDFVLSYTAPLTQSGIAELVQVVDREGKITDREGFQSYIHFEIVQKRAQEMKTLTQEARALGLTDIMKDENGNDVEVLVIPQEPTPEQKAVLEKTVAWNSLEKATRKETL